MTCWLVPSFHCEISLYAGDTVIYYSYDNAHDIENKINFDVERLCKWFDKNLLTLKISKCKIIIITWSEHIAHIQGCRRGGRRGAEPPSTISRGAEHPLYFLQTIYSSVKGSISKIKSPENRQLFMLIYWCFSKKTQTKLEWTIR